MSSTATVPMAPGATAVTPHATCCSPTVPHLGPNDVPVPPHNRTAVAGPVSITPVAASAAHIANSQAISHSHSQSQSSSNAHHAQRLAPSPLAHHHQSTSTSIRHTRERPPPLQLQSMDGTTSPRHDLSASSSPSTTPAKRAGSDSERERDASVKRRSPPHPANVPERASASPSAAPNPASASASASGPSFNMHHATASMSHGHGNATNSPLQAQHSHSNAHLPSTPHQHSQPYPQRRSHISVGAVASQSPFGGLVDLSALVAPHQQWRRRHSVASPLNLISESPSTTWSGSPTRPTLQQQQSSFRLSSQLGRAGTDPQGSAASRQATREGGAVARSPAAPRGLDDEAIYSDLSVLGFPMPQSRPDQRAPERLADRIDEWGMLSELGPVSRRELFSVGGTEHRASRGEREAHNQQAAEVQEQAPQDQDAEVQDAQGEEEVQPPEPDTPAATNVTAQAGQTAVAPEVPQAADPLLSRPSLQTIDMGLRALEQQLQQFQQRTRLSQRERAGERPSQPGAVGGAESSGPSSAANGLRPLLLGRPAGRSTAVVSSGPTLDGDMASRLHAISEMRRRLREAAAQGAAAAAQAVPAAQPASPTAPSATTTASRLRPPNLGTPVPQRDRNNAVRDWRNGVAQSSPVEGGAWSADPYVTRQSERALGVLRERLRTQIAFDPVHINGRPSDRVTPLPGLTADGDRGAGSSVPRTSEYSILGGDWLSLLNRERGPDGEPQPERREIAAAAGNHQSIESQATAAATPARIPTTASNTSVFPYEPPTTAANALAARPRPSVQDAPPATAEPRSAHRARLDSTRVWNQIIPVDTNDNFDPSNGVDPLGTPRRGLDFEVLMARRAGQPGQRHREREHERDNEREPDIAGAPPRTRPYSTARQSLYRASPGWRWEDPEQVYGAFAAEAGVADQNEARERPPVTANSPAADRFDRTTHLPSLMRSARTATGEVPSANGDNRRHIRPESLLTRTAAAESVRLADARRARRLAEAQSSAARVHEAIARLSTSATSAAADGGDPVDLDPLRRSLRWPTNAPFASASSGTAHHGSGGEPDLASSAELHSRLQLARLSRHMRSLPDETEANDAAAARAVYASLSAATLSAHRAARASAMARSEDDDRMMHLVLGTLTRYTHNMGAEAMTLDNLLLGGGNPPPSRSNLKLHSGLEPAERTKVLMAVARGLSRMPLHVRRRATQSVLTKSRWDAVKVEGDKDECCAICQDDYTPDVSVSVTPCNHMYHSSCLESWIKTPSASTCPMCRRDLAVFAIATRICSEGTAAARTMWMDTPADALAVSERL